MNFELSLITCGEYLSRNNFRNHCWISIGLCTSPYQCKHSLHALWITTTDIDLATDIKSLTSGKAWHFGSKVYRMWMRLRHISLFHLLVRFFNSSCRHFFLDVASFKGGTRRESADLAGQHHSGSVYIVTRIKTAVHMHRAVFDIHTNKEAKPTC